MYATSFRCVHTFAIKYQVHVRTVMSKTERTRGILTRAIFYRVFAYGMQERKKKTRYILCFGAVFYVVLWLRCFGSHDKILSRLIIVILADTNYFRVVRFALQLI